MELSAEASEQGIAGAESRTLNKGLTKAVVIRIAPPRVAGSLDMWLFQIEGASKAGKASNHVLVRIDAASRTCKADCGGGVAAATGQQSGA